MGKLSDISLSERFEGFIIEQVRSGQFNSASEVVEASLTLMQECDQKLQALRAALIEGEESGEDSPLNMREIVREARLEAGLDA